MHEPRYKLETEGRFHWVVRITDNERILFFEKSASLYNIATWMNYLERQDEVHFAAELPVSRNFSYPRRLVRLKRAARLAQYGDGPRVPDLKEKFFVFLEEDSTEVARDVDNLIKEGVGNEK